MYPLGDDFANLVRLRLTVLEAQATLAALTLAPGKVYSVVAVTDRSNASWTPPPSRKLKGGAKSQRRKKSGSSKPGVKAPKKSAGRKVSGSEAGTIMLAIPEEVELNEYGTTHLPIKPPLPYFHELAPGVVAAPTTPKDGGAASSACTARTARSANGDDVACSAIGDSARSSNGDGADDESEGEDVPMNAYKYIGNTYHVAWTMIETERIREHEARTLAANRAAAAAAAKAEVEVAAAAVAARAKMEFRVVFRDLRARDVPQADAKGGSDPYIKFTLLDCGESLSLPPPPPPPPPPQQQQGGGSAVGAVAGNASVAAPTARTQPVMNTSTPSWDGAAQLRVPPGCPAAITGKPKLLLELFDEDKTDGDDLLSRAVVQLDQPTGSMSDILLEGVDGFGSSRLDMSYDVSSPSPTPSPLTQ